MRRSHPTYRAYQRAVEAVEEPWVAWFGGWLCADGSIMAPARIRFTICDRDPLDEFSRVLGGTVSRPMPASGLGAQPRYSWQISGWRAEIVLNRVKPWLSARYSARSERAIASRNAPRPRKLSESDVGEIKARLLDGETGRSIAASFRISEGMVCHIRKGRQWADIEPKRRA